MTPLALSLPSRPTHEKAPREAKSRIFQIDKKALQRVGATSGTRADTFFVIPGSERLRHYTFFPYGHVFIFFEKIC